MDAPHAAGGAGPATSGSAALKVSPLPGRSGIHARGEISALTRPTWEQALSDLARRHTGVTYVELSDVAFVDVAGVTALALTAMNLPDGRVVVEHPPPQLPRVLDIFWPGLNRIEVASR
ncbi:STAS domain-containing protein [Streptomyces sp. NPDC054844]